ncbi:MAG: tryptophan--tRNA ligase, partial [Pseudomonadota bacterium]
YGALKQAAADAVNAVLQPLQAAQAAWVANPELPHVLVQGAQRAEAVANATLARVKDVMGYWKP